MSLSSIRTSLAAKVAAVVGIAGVAPVHDYWRLVKTADELQSVLVGGNQERLHFWFVTMAGTNPLTIVQAMGCQYGIYRWDIHGYYAIEDAPASEKAFLNIVEKVMDSLRTDYRLGDTVIEVSGEWPSWAEFNAVTIVNVDCHHVRLTASYKQRLA